MGQGLRMGLGLSASHLEDARREANTRHALKLVRVLEELGGEHAAVAHLFRVKG